MRMVQQMSELENVMPLLSCNFLPVVSRGMVSVRFSSRERKVGFQRCGPLGWENPQLPRGLPLHPGSWPGLCPAKAWASAHRGHMPQGTGQEAGMTASRSTQKRIRSKESRLGAP